MPLTHIGRIIFGFGVLIAFSGLVLMALGKFLGTPRLLPGDIYIERGNLRVYFPVVTCLVLSIMLTVVLNFVAGMRR